MSQNVPYFAKITTDVTIKSHSQSCIFVFSNPTLIQNPSL
ncbi:hypothetical protein HBZC1_10560 [Helicobacter bizzozeronii CIII-1]|uniref:Uncharacterized protein n=1 Tax=Helicobacter bizzozeronii (strain CIII-1) TaxID=1002804 RepID=F8KT91_HELBC|nr:hypothetical protein HBZC1_10560 [Helicobacter bizzozeronii CIII-1]